jgi:hypothetical protein
MEKMRIRMGAIIHLLNRAIPERPRKVIVCLVLMGSMFAIFYVCPVLKIDDSKYTMLLSEHLLLKQQFYLDKYFWPHVDSRDYPEVKPGKVLPRHVSRFKGHLYYVYPHGTAVLSIPLVAVMRLAGVSTIKPDGRYDFQGEIKMQKLAAAFLMALTGVVFFSTAKLLLSGAWSMLIAAAGCLGTQIWSTASRSMQSHTWSVLLMAFAVYLLLRAELGKGKLRPVLLATIFSAGFFVRPTLMAYIVPLSILVLIRYRRQRVWFMATGMIWIAIFFFYSQYHFHNLLPLYFRFGNALDFDNLGIGLASNLFSPSRGLFVFVPLVVFIGYLLAAHPKSLQNQSLIIASLVSILAHLLIISTWWAWWAGAGGTYGARFTTDLVPLFVLLGIIGTRAALYRHRYIQQQRQSVMLRLRRSFEVTALVFCLFISMLFNGAGAISKYGSRWNRMPDDIDQNPKRIFDWKNSQFYCALFPKTISGNIKTEEGTPIKGIGITFSQGGGRTLTNADGTYIKAVGYGWSGTAKPQGGTYSYDPPKQDYSRIAASQTNQNYTCTPLKTPVAPIMLRAVALSRKRIKLSWEDRSRNEDGFKIERHRNQKEAWELIAVTKNDIESYQDKISEGDAFFQYRIYSFNSKGKSAYSNIVEVKAKRK